LREYIWLAGRPVAVVDGVDTANPVLLHVHVDHLDRPVMMTDPAGALVWQARYEPFGAVTELSGPAALAYRFPGQWFMLELGLHYNWHRWYDASTGRYTQPDPLGMPDGPSRYAYAKKSPLMYVDPDGRNPLALIPPLVNGARIAWPWLSGGAGALTGGLLGDAIFNQEADAEGEACPVTPPHDPAVPPGEGWEWRGNGPPGSDEGAWYHPDTGASLHPDFSHPPPIGPHYDYQSRGGPKWRVQPGSRKMTRKPD
jgi:RHS repeat-associated protein